MVHQPLRATWGAGRNELTNRPTVGKIHATERPMTTTWTRLRDTNRPSRSRAVDERTRRGAGAGCPPRKVPAAGPAAACTTRRARSLSHSDGLYSSGPRPLASRSRRTFIIIAGSTAKNKTTARALAMCGLRNWNISLYMRLASTSVPKLPLVMT